MRNTAGKRGRPAGDTRVLLQTRAAIARVEPHIGRTPLRNRISVLVGLEMLAFTPHKAIADAYANGGDVAALLSPYTPDELARMSNTRGMAELAMSLPLFPLCRSAVSESMSMGAYTFESTASVETLSANTRAANQLYRGRMPAPLTESTPFLLPIALINFHTDQAL